MKVCFRAPSGDWTRGLDRIATAGAQGQARVQRTTGSQPDGPTTCSAGEPVA
jgi:hypothetical protein